MKKAASKKLKRSKSMSKVKSLRVPGQPPGVDKLNPQPLPP
jgi:hypothetical protein